ncbi:MAG: hypothetical protein FJ029_15050, partial [Actinobacteria bacterium]|nr:hypothetical protein [Actinomycetota bacterium]
LRARGTAASLAQFDVAGTALSWLTVAAGATLRQTANTVNGEVMQREASTSPRDVVTALLRQLRAIRESSGLLGLHWPDPHRSYRDGAPFVERVVCFAEPAAEYHRERVRMRVQQLRARHPGSPIVLRIDYRPGRAIPRSEAERTEYYPQLESIISAWEFRGLLLQQGNEPQFEGTASPEELAREFNGWGRPPADTGNFWSRCRTIDPSAAILPSPLAPFHPAGPHTPNPAGLEDSPWARLAYQTKRRILEAGLAHGRLPSAWSEHVYGDPPPAGANADREAWADVRAPGAGYRWGMNVAATWQAVNVHVEREFDLPPLPVWVTEFNTAARGTAPPHLPTLNYARGWLVHALAQMTQAFPTLQGGCWFVGDSASHDGQRTDFALHGGAGRLADLERDYQDLHAAGV